MKFRIWKSLTFFIGLILFIAAFGVILVAGSIFNPLTIIHKSAWNSPTQWLKFTFN